MGISNNFLGISGKNLISQVMACFLRKIGAKAAFVPFRKYEDLRNKAISMRRCHVPAGL